ncbi:phage head closure protein [uncultured Staphylococcus sp.]|uniref:phage head closure protein n=1 Tax=uncultured Staphylococcus sp. TaxID=189668 RepID=UPI0025FF7F9F|nr:phage head closure protein [uncultured Staphylococcus sp.]
MYDPFVEFPHEIEMGHKEVVGRPPKQRACYVHEKTIKGFMDTPTSSEQLLYHQMTKDFDRNLYTPYDIAIDSATTLFKYNGRVYQCASEPIDQGGQNEINLTRLKVVPIEY